jgi:hypothetical protein
VRRTPWPGAQSDPRRQRSRCRRAGPSGAAVTVEGGVAVGKRDDRALRNSFEPWRERTRRTERLGGEPGPRRPAVGAGSAHRRKVLCHDQPSRSRHVITGAGRFVGVGGKFRGGRCKAAAVPRSCRLHTIFEETGSARTGARLLEVMPRTRRTLPACPEPAASSARPPGGPRPPAPPATGEPNRRPDPADPGPPITVRLGHVLIGDLGHPRVDARLLHGPAAGRPHGGLATQPRHRRRRARTRVSRLRPGMALARCRWGRCILAAVPRTFPPTPSTLGSSRDAARAERLAEAPKSFAAASQRPLG